ncbi:MAG: PIN domain-containing protein [Defluviitaleaceae bacterium]|nr:PIN domain-containing protein [Defluviitaleaceae bacterium]
MIYGIIGAGDFELFSSRMIDFELNKIKDMSKKMNVTAFYESIKSETLKFCDEIEIVASAYEMHGIGYMDALHIAYCQQYQIDYMLTTDKALINVARRVGISFKVVNPLEFIMEVL